jgi:hypothetical protein
MSGPTLTDDERTALQAANRIMHEPPPHSENDVQLVAGALLLALLTSDEDRYVK